MANPKILLVDDSEFFLEMEKGFLKQSDVTVFTAENGQAALELAGKVRPDLICMGLNMRGMAGDACCSKLKTDPLLRSIPVIMVIVAGSDRDMDACRKAGCDALLTRPVDRKLFLETCRSFLDRIDRREQRIPCRSMVHFRLNNDSFYGTIEDVSPGGMFVGFPHEIAVGSVIDMKFLLPGGDAGLIETSAEVCWVNSGRRFKNSHLPKGFGTMFQGLNSDAVETIRAFIEHTELRLQMTANR